MTKVMYDKTVAQLYGLTSLVPPKSVGIEVELEFPPGVSPSSFINFAPKKWDSHSDGSLANGLEIVTVPIVPNSRDWATAKKELIAGFNLVPAVASERTSTHVHLNTVDLTLGSVLKGSCALWLMEGILFRLCAPHRRQNHFCLGISQSPAIVDRLIQSFSTGETPRIRSDSYKYSSVNWGRLVDLGTIESRIREGLTDADEIFDWAELLSSVFYTGAEFDGTPADFINSVVDNPDGSAENMFGRFYDSLGLSNGSVEASVMDGLCSLVPILTFDWNFKDQLESIKKVHPVKIDFPVLTEDDNFFEDDPIIEFSDEDIVEDPVSDDTILPIVTGETTLSQSFESPLPMPPPRIIPTELLRTAQVAGGRWTLSDIEDTSRGILSDFNARS